jgi:hypothetical protein
MTSFKFDWTRIAAAGAAFFAIAVLPLGQAVAATSYSTGFEDPPFTVGPMSPDIATTQGGWSGGAQGGFTNNDHAVGNEDEAITTADVHSGLQSWRLSRGYGSPGQGVPYSPIVENGDGNGVAADGEMLLASLWFKAVSAGDGTVTAIETGTADGTDRGNYLARLSNEAGGIRIYSFENGAAFDEVTLFSGVSATDWHSLDIKLTKSGFVDTVSLSLDGGTPVSYNAALNEWRQTLPSPYADHSRLRIRPTSDGDLAQLGYYFDDVSYSVVNAVPEPASLVLLLSAITSGLLGRRRS